MKENHFYVLLAVAGVAAYLVGRGAVKLIESGAEAITPTNPNNIFYGGVNAIGDTFDNGMDDDSFSLGGWIYDITHPNAEYMQ